MYIYVDHIFADKPHCTQKKLNTELIRNPISDNLCLIWSRCSKEHFTIGAKNQTFNMKNVV